MLSIGEFSKAAQLTVKTLRLYHEKGLLIPNIVDKRTGYRYYDSSAMEKAKIITFLKNMGLSLSEIGEIIDNASEDTDILNTLKNKLAEIESKINNYKTIQENIKKFLIINEQTNELNQDEVQKTVIDDMIICSIRIRGKYSDIGVYFNELYKKAGRYIKGKPFALYYDKEYKEDNADMEICLEVKQPIDISGITCRKLPGGKALVLEHKGPYDSLGLSYTKLFESAQSSGFEIYSPSREMYIKGPGMIFTGNPIKYLTKLVFLYSNSRGKIYRSIK